MMVAKAGRATPRTRSECRDCEASAIAKCGAIKIWHWAHDGENCDPWTEGETAWHLAWKDLVPTDRCEVKIGSHRADSTTPDGYVVEFQHSFLAPAMIREREDH